MLLPHECGSPYLGIYDEEQQVIMYGEYRLGSEKRLAKRCDFLYMHTEKAQTI